MGGYRSYSGEDEVPRSWSRYAARSQHSLLWSGSGEYGELKSATNRKTHSRTP
jgi:hypothetical protein